ncbi:MAG: glycosyltransferase, partial [Opitutales bacterium]|nr:glycosyltransferase [Opitutales bacterium]
LELGRRTSSFLNLFKSLQLTAFVKLIYLKGYIRQMSLILERHNPEFCMFHNIHGAGWPLEIVRVAANYCPTSWTLHDCSSFLGSYYPSHSPLPSDEEKLRLGAYWDSFSEQKTRFSLCAVTPSEWMNNQAKPSSWSDHLVKTIHNPVSSSYFEKRDQGACKQALGVITEKPLILCIAGNLEEERKGGNILREILNSEFDDVHFLLIGRTTKSISDHKENIYSLGFIQDELTMQIAYHAADLVLHPAPIDNLPNTVAEAMSAGTPILSFQTGGLPEMVVPGKSGWLVPEINAQLMAQELHSIIKSKSYNNLRNSTKELAEKLFAPKEIEKQYKELIQGLVS